MAEVSELPLWVRAYLRMYRWRRIDPVPLARRTKPVAESRVALVTTAGLVPPDAPPFDATVKGGDFSYRVIGADTDVAALEEHHRSESFDHAGIALDRNLAFPLDRLRELAAAGEIGDVAPRHLSFMGSITAPGRLSTRTAPEAARLLLDDGVDLALLVPV
ncbi:MAG: glycine/sarcosine/betaine reductase selenoprotein B family protein [Anaeromyxobacteraceae bacterium]